jgi:glycosyltransferase involved in cell wall biosynthesis
MRALFVVRRNLTIHTGGDTTQILSTADALRALGVGVDLVHDVPKRLDRWDVVHLFHLDRLWENIPHLAAVRRRRPVVLSPIWWPKDDYNAHARRGVQGVLARAVGTGAYDVARVAQRSVFAFAEHPARTTVPRPAAWRFGQAARRLLRESAVVLPNSLAEVTELQRHFGAGFEWSVVPNGFTQGTPYPSGHPDDPVDVLCVARIEPRKNQLELIRALTGEGLSTVLVGQAGRFSRRYERTCRAAATSMVTFAGRVPHEQVRHLYHRARVHVLPSWFETPGLASLEAAGAGARIVVGDCPPVREYFGDLAIYCDPGDQASIRDAVRSALDRPADPRLRDLVTQKYTWSAAATATQQAYQLACRRVG